MFSLYQHPLKSWKCVHNFEYIVIRLIKSHGRYLFHFCIPSIEHVYLCWVLSVREQERKEGSWERERSGKREDVRKEEREKDRQTKLVSGWA